MSVRILLSAMLAYAVVAFICYILVASLQPATHTFAERFWGG